MVRSREDVRRFWHNTVPNSNYHEVLAEYRAVWRQAPLESMEAMDSLVFAPRFDKQE